MHVYLPWMCIFLAPSKVLKTLQKMADPPAAFPLKSQYVPAVCAAQAADKQDDDQDQEDLEEPDPKPLKSRPRKRKVDEVADDSKSPWNYNEIRVSFIKKLQGEGVSFSDAKEQWDKSEDKRLFLQDVSVKELKRRKFIPKDCTVNPWATK